MSTYNFAVPPPKIEEREFINPLRCGPGPNDIYPEVTEALTKPIISPMCDEYYNVIDDIRAGIQYIFQTNSKLVLAISGAGHSGMETVISNLVAPKETLLIAARGIWDERASIMASRYGIKVVKFQVPFNTAFKLSQLEPLLKKHRPTALFITHGDSSTGTVQNLIGLGDLCHKYGALLLTDTVVSLCAEPFLMDEWGVDGVYTSTQKALSGPAGISPVAFSARAEKKIKNRKHEPSFYFDVKLLAEQWNCYDSNIVYHHTLSPPLLWALRCCLQNAIKETLPSLWARHRIAIDHFHKRLEQLPVEHLIPNPEERLVTVTTIVLPKGYDYKEIVQYVRAKHNVIIFIGLGPTAGKALRIGIMGVNATIRVADIVADVIEDALKALAKAKL